MTVKVHLHQHKLETTTVPLAVTVGVTQYHSELLENLLQSTVCRSDVLLWSNHSIKELSNH